MILSCKIKITQILKLIIVVGYDMEDNSDKKYENIDKGGCLWSIIGILFPYVGVVLYFLFRRSKPNTAEAVGKGTLISVLFVGIIVLIIVGIALITSYIRSQSSI